MDGVREDNKNVSKDGWNDDVDCYLKCEPNDYCCTDC
jgi:hypothetical protein